jgi:phenylpropionate dioxygenase-like ring-hydroxylating dioxygenase large terminal subunit
MIPSTDDRVVDEWFPVATVRDVALGAAVPFLLLGERLLLLRTRGGDPLVVSDTCPHRGAQLSLGSFDGSCLRCAYHGWEFDTSGACTFQPAQPDRTPPAGVGLHPIAVQEAYGLYWVCIGSDPRGLPRYDDYGAHPGRTVYLGPERLSSCGPRIVENFLDMAHFPFVHRDYLGVPPHTAVRPYDVAAVDGELVMTNCVFFQPLAGPTASEGSDVEYVYVVPGPYSARLTKTPGEADGGAVGAFSILLVTSPEDEFTSRCWLLTTVHDPDADLGSFERFNRVIFDQDIPIVESQRPRRLPVDPREEVHQRADKVSLAYRKYLVDRGVRYGTTANGGPEHCV